MFYFTKQRSNTEYGYEFQIPNTKLGIEPISTNYNYCLPTDVIESGIDFITANRAIAYLIKRLLTWRGSDYCTTLARMVFRGRYKMVKGSIGCHNYFELFEHYLLS